MFTEKTVFVLGAGASAPFDFPTGRTLKDQVASQIIEGRDLYMLLMSSGFSNTLLMEFAVTLRDSGQPSIDAFIERRGKFLEAGKAAIAAALLPYEEAGHLFMVQGKGHKESDANWYDLLFNMLSEKATRWEDLGDNQLSIITFNYDRSLEQYLSTALRNSYDLGEQDVAAVMTAIPIEHVYGSLGILPWQDQEGSGLQVVPYAGQVTAENVNRAAASITILPEGDQNPEAFSRAGELIRETRYLYFLGFGYHPLNLKRLGLDGKDQFDYARIAGTSFGLSAWASDTIRGFHSLAQLRGDHPNVSCRNLLPKTVYPFLHNHVTGNGWRP